MLRQVHAYKPQSLLDGCNPMILKYTSALMSRSFPSSVNRKTHKIYSSLRPGNGLVCLHPKTPGRVLLKSGPRHSGVCNLVSFRSFSSSDSLKFTEPGEKPLPWLVQARGRDTGLPQKVVSPKASKSSWEESAQKYFKGGDSEENVNQVLVQSEVLADEEEAVEDEPVDNPRWDKIKDRFNRVSVVRPEFQKPESKRWNRQENWGRKTFKEASESSVPKIVGEGIYGVGPILAALLAERREFYALYIQEGIDLNKNNKRKKDKKGFEKILQIADQIGLSQKEVSKHDLNMVSDNRPHQGLVLDASPLEMVGIKELEPVSAEGGGGHLWVALDEVTDPQNLGAIVRSSYFFGASGVVLCAKNSARLSGVVSKASAGSLELMEIRCCKNMMQFLSSSAENGWRVLGGSVSSRAVPLHEITPGASTILVLGSEGTGLRPLVERSCTELIKIPGNIPVDFISGEDEDGDSERSEGSRGSVGEEFKSFMAVESLNVSVAAGVLLHHLAGIGSSNNGAIQEELTDSNK